MNSIKIGILGGGQLGKMMYQAGISLDFNLFFLDPAADAPCALLSKQFTQGDFNDFETVLSFGRQMDVVTIEIEHVNVMALRQLKQEGIKVYPDPETIAIIQDKGTQKAFYQQHGLPTAPFRLIESPDQKAFAEFGFPLVQKMRKGGYDGKGVSVLNSIQDLHKAFHSPSVLEQKVDFEKEIAVMVARNAKGEVKAYPAVEMEFNAEANLVEFLFAPAQISAEIAHQAQTLAMQCAEALQLIGSLAVEFFVTRDGQLLINEAAPRVHNSGHHTIEASYTSQFEQHLRAVANLPLGDTSLRCPAVMVNLLGAPNHQGRAKYQGMEEALRLGGVYPHLYGKSTTKPFRKMGHATILDHELEKAKTKARTVLNTIKIVAEG